MAKQISSKTTASKVSFKPLSPFLPDVAGKKIFMAVALFIGIAMLWVSKDYGITGDENYHRVYGHHVMDFYFTLGKDDTATKQYGNIDTLMRFYGGFYDGTAAVLATKIFKNSDEWRVRHGWNSFLGWLAMVFTGLVVVEIAGWQAGVIALILIACSPRFLGESMNNPKDIPLAMGYMLAYFFMVRFWKNIQHPNWRFAIGLGLSIGVAMGIRIGGLLLIPYFLLFYSLYFLQRYSLGELLTAAGFKRLVVPSFKWVLVAVPLAYFSSLLFWPFGLIKPFTNPLITLEYMSKFPVNIRILFEGKYLGSTEVPWYYIPKWFLISTPIVILIGFAASFAAIPYYRQAGKILFVGFLYFTLVFPIAYVIYKKSALYDTMRHFFFVYPSIVMLAAIAIDYFINKLSNKTGKWICIGFTLLLLLLPIRHILSNHPNQYVYFNEIVGGMKGGYGNYELDYYMNSVKQCADWIKQQNYRGTRDKKTNIFTNAADPTYQYFIRDTATVAVGYTRYGERIEKDGDYFIFYNRFIDRSILLANAFPPEQSEFVVKVDGYPIACVVKKTDKNDFLGNKALLQGDVSGAISLLESYVAKYPKNELAWTNLGMAYINASRWDDALSALNAALQVYPDNANAAYYLGLAYFYKGDPATAAGVLTQLVNAQPYFAGAYQVLAACYDKMGNRNQAEYYLNIYRQLGGR
jgi:hypothetical protein